MAKVCLRIWVFFEGAIVVLVSVEIGGGFFRFPIPRPIMRAMIQEVMRSAPWLVFVM